jgi:hypothetical protein
MMQKSGVIAIFPFLNFTTAAITTSGEKQSRNILFPRALHKYYSRGSLNTNDFWAIKNASIATPTGIT